MDRFAQADALVAKAKSQAQSCQKEYERSLADKSVHTGLLIDIKQVIDGLRAALDYCARELFERHGRSEGDPKVYFPIPRKGALAKDFPKFLNAKIPGLAAARPDLAKLLESFQEFASPDNAWLPDLATLSNENKHENLTPQTRTETKELRIESLGVGISLGHGAAISLDPGGSIQVGGAILPGNQLITPGGAVAVRGPANVQHIIWVAFLFDSIKQPVIPFLERATVGVGGIVAAVRAAA